MQLFLYFIMNNLLKKELKATHTQKEDKKRRKQIKTRTTNKQRNKTYCKKLKGFRE